VRSVGLATLRLQWGAFLDTEYGLLLNDLLEQLVTLLERSFLLLIELHA
jgi:hypothetical protein